MADVNIKRLAEELKISPATVSRALRDSYEISLETKEKVWALAKKLNYEPNPFASSLRKQKSKTIAVVIPEIANHFFSLAINGIEEIARVHDYHVLIYQTHENFEQEIAIINRLLNGRVDGILISASSTTANHEQVLQSSKNVPIVFFDRLCEDIDAVKIITNDYESAFNATQHLINNDCLKPAYLLALDKITTGRNRLAGYKAALQANNISFDEELILQCVKDTTENIELIKDFLTSQKPDGVASSIEELALPFYYCCKELGLKIPDDVKIISFSNLETAPLLNPSLSTVTQPAFEIGKESAAILFKILANKYFDGHITHVLDSTLIERESTASRKAQ